MVKHFFRVAPAISSNLSARCESKPGGILVYAACFAVGHFLQRTSRRIFTLTRCAESAKSGFRLAVAGSSRVQRRARNAQRTAVRKARQRLVCLQRVVNVKGGVPAYSTQLSRVNAILIAMNIIAAYARITGAIAVFDIQTRPQQPSRALPSRAAPGG